MYIDGYLIVIIHDFNINSQNNNAIFIIICTWAIRIYAPELIKIKIIQNVQHPN